jgi:hypothetical protein
MLDAREFHQLRQPLRQSAAIPRRDADVDDITHERRVQLLDAFAGAPAKASEYLGFLSVKLQERIEESDPDEECVLLQR